MPRGGIAGSYSSFPGWGGLSFHLPRQLYRFTFPSAVPKCSNVSPSLPTLVTFWFLTVAFLVGVRLFQ